MDFLALRPTKVLTVSILSEVLAMIFLPLFAKFKRDLGLPVGAHFLHDFSTKMFLI